MIDLHLHTTASDGLLSPQALVDRVAAAGVTVMAVTDHDTTAATAVVQAAARAAGIEAVPGIEITAIDNGRDVHVLGYFFSVDHHGLATLLAAQRQRRVDRLVAMADRLAQLGMPVDLTGFHDEMHRQPGRSAGRPQIARAMVAAGWVGDTREAFDAWLSVGRPAFVPREGPTVAEVIGILHAAGGVASLAHPGKTQVDSRLWEWRRTGLDAIEVYHPEHDAGACDYYARTAIDMGFLVTGGSDFHADPAHGVEPGSSTLPAHEWQRLRSAPRSHG